MSLIRQPHEIVLQPKLKVLIYGQAGMGKSTLALSMPKPLLIDCDGGAHRINVMHRVPTLQVDSYDQILEVLKEDLREYETIVIDTGGKMLDFIATYLIKRNSKLGKANGSLTLQGYGERKQEFSAFVKQVSMLNKHIVFVAHRETRTEDDNTRFVPLFGGSNYDSLVTELDLVGYLEANGNQRILTFNGTSRNDGKNTCNLPSVMELPVVVDTDGIGITNTFLTTNVVAQYVRSLEMAKEFNVRFSNLIGELKEQVVLITDALSANDFIARIDAFEHIGNSKSFASSLLREKASKLNLTFNKETKRYE